MVVGRLRQGFSAAGEIGSSTTLLLVAMIYAFVVKNSGLILSRANEIAQPLALCFGAGLHGAPLAALNPAAGGCPR